MYPKWTINCDVSSIKIGWKIIKFLGIQDVKIYMDAAILTISWDI